MPKPRTPRRYPTIRPPAPHEQLLPRHVTLKLTPKLAKTYDSLENKSAFFKTALGEAVGVMTWALMQKRAPERYFETARFEDLIEPYNEAFPQHPDIIKMHKAKKDKREGINSANPRSDSQSHPELW